MTGAAPDVLLRFRRWHARLARLAAPDRESVQRLATVSRCIDEITRLRRRVEELEGERAKLEAMATSPRRLP